MEAVGYFIHGIDKRETQCRKDFELMHNMGVYKWLKPIKEGSITVDQFNFNLVLLTSTLLLRQRTSSACLLLLLIPLDGTEKRSRRCINEKQSTPI